MKKNLLICLIIFAAINIGLGQQPTDKVKIEWGEALKGSKKASLEDVIGYDDNGYYILKTDGKSYIELLDDQLYLKTSTQLNLKDIEKGLEQEGLIYFNDEILLLTSKRDRTTKVNTLYMQKVNKTLLKPAKKRIKLGEIEFERRNNAGTFSYVISNDEKKLLIYYNMPYEKASPEKFGIHVLDESLATIWDREMELPYKDNLFFVEQFRLDNNGNVYVSGVEYEDEASIYRTRKKGNDGAKYKYHILAYNKDNERVKDYEIALNDKFITDLQFEVADNGDLICGGFFSENGTYSIKGSFFLKVDGKTKTIVSQNYKEFGEDFITQHWSKKQVKKAKKKEEKKGKSIEMYEYDLDDIILREDGGAVLIGEQYYTYTYSYTSTDGNGNSRTVYVTVYVYNDILVVNTNPDGTISWINKIPKRQSTSNDGGYYSSYALAVVKDRLYFVFNDNIMNLDANKDPNNDKIHRFSLKEGVCVLAEMKMDGSFEKEALFNLKDEKFITRPKVCEQTSDNEMIIFGKFKRTNKFARVIFDQ